MGRHSQDFVVKCCTSVEEMWGLGLRERYRRELGIDSWGAKEGVGSEMEFE